jgi:ABC-type lipoprotein release transport system permease subunit
VSRLKGLIARSRSLRSRRAAETRMEEEFAFHVEMETSRSSRRGVTTMEEAVSSGFATSRSAASVAGFFGLLALLIASVGLYAVVAANVAERTREIGVRVALGATPPNVLRHFMRSGAEREWE